MITGLLQLVSSTYSGSGTHYYGFETYQDTWDALAALASMFLTFSVLVSMVSAVRLLINKPRRSGWIVFTSLILLSGGYYVVSYILEIQSVLSVVTNPGGDITPGSALRSAAIGIIIFLSSIVMDRYSHLRGGYTDGH